MPGHRLMCLGESKNVILDARDIKFYVNDIRDLSKKIDTVTRLFQIR